MILQMNSTQIVMIAVPEDVREFMGKTAGQGL